MKKRLASFKRTDAAAGITPRLFNMAMPTNSKMNHGNKDVKETLFCSVCSVPVATCFWFTLNWIQLNTKTVGIMDKVRVNLTIVAKSPAASEKAYPAATTLEVSLIAVPVHNP